MDLQISVFLLFLLFTAGHSLSCYQCSDTSNPCAQVTCPSEQSSCLAITGYLGDLYAKLKTCYLPSICPSGSANLGILRASSYCCNTDGCNAQDAPDPSSNNPNGNTCYYCDGQICNKTLACSGNQDRCVTVTGTYVGSSVTYKGCASNSLCSSTIPFPNFSNYTCCSGNLCNGAESVHLSFLFLCCFLFPFYMMH